jgi:hypothetical protein
MKHVLPDLPSALDASTREPTGKALTRDIAGYQNLNRCPRAPPGESGVRRSRGSSSWAGLLLS